MPSPGAGAIAEQIGAKKYTVEGGYKSQFTESGEFIKKLAMALDTGWISVSPVIQTSMVLQFNVEFTGYLSGYGLLYVNCIARGIDYGAV